MDKPHNHGKRRRMEKAMAKVLRNPAQRKQFFDALINESLRWSSPFRSMPMEKNEGR